MGELAERPEADRVADGVGHQRALAGGGANVVRVVPERVRAAQLHVDEAVGRIPLLDQRVPRDRHAVEAQPVLEQRPGCTSIGPGVTTRKRSSGGVIASRLRASAKNGKTSSGGPSSRCSRCRTWVRMTSATGLGWRTMSCAWVTCARPPSRRCAPTTTCAARRARRCSIVYADFTCPRCALAAAAPARRARAGRASATSRWGAPPARAPARARERGGGAPGRVLGDARRALRRPGPHRRSAPLGALRARSGSTRSASRPTAAARRSPSGSRATCARRCARGRDDAHARHRRGAAPGRAGRRAARGSSLSAPLAIDAVTRMAGHDRRREPNAGVAIDAPTRAWPPRPRR